MNKHSTGVTIPGVAAGESALSNYSVTYDAWDEEDGEECPACYGTGLDRDELYDCPECYGEGFIVPLDTALGTR